MSQSKIPFVNLKQVNLDPKNTKIHKNTYKYISSCLFDNSNYNEHEIITLTKKIGTSKNDKIICLANLFSIAIKSDRISLMQRIMDEYKDCKETQKFIVNAYNKDYTPLMRAAYNGSIESVKFLLGYGADIKIINIENEDIFSATKVGLVEKIKAKPHLKLLITNKYKEIYEYLSWWNKSDTTIEMRMASVKIEDYKSLKHKQVVKPVEFKMPENSLLNIAYNIYEQIDEFIESYVEATNGTKMEKLFNEINLLLEHNIIQVDKTKVVIDKYIKDLTSDFDDIFPILKLDVCSKVVEAQPSEESAAAGGPALVEPKLAPIPVEPKKKSIKLKSLIDSNEDINEQLLAYIPKYIEEYDTDMLKNIFNDINTLIKNLLITPSEVKAIIEPHHDTLMSDFIKQYSILKL